MTCFYETFPGVHVSVMVVGQIFRRKRQIVRPNDPAVVVCLIGQADHKKEPGLVGRVSSPELLGRSRPEPVYGHRNEEVFHVVTCLHSFSFCSEP